MNKYHKELQSLWQRIVAGKSFSEADEETATVLMKCEEPFAQFVAKLVKVVRGGTRSSELFLLLEAECALGFERSRQYALEVLFMLGDFAIDKIGSSKSIRSFTFAAARSEAVDARTNAVHILAALASCNDKEAISLLEQLRTDQIPGVRLTAHYYWSQIRDSGKVTRIF